MALGPNGVFVELVRGWEADLCLTATQPFLRKIAVEPALNSVRYMKKIEKVHIGLEDMGLFSKLSAS